jgi:FxsC-like protein
VEPGPKLAEHLEKARQDQTILVLLVDPWALHLPAYSECAAVYDERDLWNGSVLIPWNEDDAETQNRASDLQDLIDKVFENKATATLRIGKTWAYRGTVSSASQLAAELRRVLTHIRSVIINKAEKPRRAVGPRAIPLPQLSGPGRREP